MELENEVQIARRLGLSPGTIANQRVRGDGPPYLKIGRSVRYNPAEVEAWLESRKRQSTSQAA